MPSLKFALVLTNRFLAMYVALPPNIIGVHLSLTSLGSIASKRARSNDTNDSTTVATIERVSTSLLIYEDTKMIVEKYIKMKWKEVNDAFSSTFGEISKTTKSM